MCMSRTRRAQTPFELCQYITGATNLCWLTCKKRKHIHILPGCDSAIWWWCWGIDYWDYRGGSKLGGIIEYLLARPLDN